MIGLELSLTSCVEECIAINALIVETMLAIIQGVQNVTQFMNFPVPHYKLCIKNVQFRSNHSQSKMLYGHLIW